MASSDPADSRVLVIGCGALARELLQLTRVNPLSWVTVECLPAWLHNRPEQIPAAVQQRIRRARPAYRRIFVGYADCGTGGALDRMLEAEGIDRLPGAHCYEFYAGAAVFGDLQEAQPGTFYLTDYLARHFDRLVIGGLGLDRHPELLDDYFGNYRRLVYLAQVDDPGLTRRAQAAAAALGLEFERLFTGYGELGEALADVAAVSAVS